MSRPKGFKMSEESKEKKRVSMLGKNKYIRTEEMRKHMGDARRGKKHSEESKRKIAIAHLGVRRLNMEGSLNPKWKGGINSLVNRLRSCFQYRQWRSDVYTRDNFTCQDCGDKKGGNLEADHIKPFSKIIEIYSINSFDKALECEELWDINNGRTLCKICHINKHKKYEN